MLYSWDICVWMINRIATVHPWNINARVPNQEFIVAEPCDWSWLWQWWKRNLDASNKTYSVFICFHMQLYRDYHQVCHSLAVSCAVVKIVGLVKCSFWGELSQEVARMSKYFPFDILIDTLTPDRVYRSNLKNRYPIYIAYRYAALEIALIGNTASTPLLLSVWWKL